MVDPSELLQTAISHHRAGRLAEAQALYRRVLEREPRNADVLHLLGTLAHQQGDNERALDLIHEAIGLNPRNPNYPFTLGTISLALGRPAQAVAAFLSVLRLRPDLADAHLNLAAAYKAQGDPAGALRHLHEALRLRPAFAEGYYNLANLHAEEGRLAEAIAGYRKTIELDPRHGRAYNNLGLAFHKQGDLSAATTSYEAAIECYQKALALNPTRVEIYVNVGLALNQLRRVDDVVAWYRAALQRIPGCAPIYEQLCNVRKGACDQADIDVMEEILSHPDLGDEQRVQLHFALAKALEDHDEYDAAFAHYLEANRRKRASFDYALEMDIDFFARIAELFDEGFFKERADWGVSDATPIFIVGMPRSGTTLAEQILASHPLVHGAGELEVLGDLIRSVPRRYETDGYPEGVASLDRVAFRALATAYLDRVRIYSAGASHVTDKMPGNFCYVGMIRIMFPRAKVIHCQRDPVDTCLSCFKSNFSDPQYFAYDLIELGRYYRAYRRLMRHWHDVLPGFIFGNRYEDLIADQEGQTRRLLEFCGLPWDDACLNYHGSRRPVQTVSLNQVRQPIYRSSMGAWRRYERQLAPLLDALDR